MYLPLAIFASFAFLYSILAGRLEKTPISGPVVFITFGLLVGPLGAGWLQLDVTSTELVPIQKQNTENKPAFRFKKYCPFRQVFWLSI